MKIKRYEKYIGVLASIAVAGSLVAVPVFADIPVVTATTGLNVNGSAMMHGRMGGERMKMPGVFGKVTAISGNTITVAGGAGVRGGTVATTYTVDATNAKVMKANVASTVSNIAVGDMVAVTGTVSGTNVAATAVYDGLMMKGNMGVKQEMNGEQNGMMNYPITGNGQPVIAGTISSINGTSVTVTNKSNVSYTADVTNAKVVQGQTLVTASNLKVGDNVVIQGTVNGTTIVASSVIDGMAQVTTRGTEKTTGTAKHEGFFGGIGNFFSKIFGF